MRRKRQLSEPEDNTSFKRTKEMQCEPQNNILQYVQSCTTTKTWRCLFHQNYEICGQNFSSLNTMIYHLKLEHDLEVSDPLTSNLNSIKDHICDVDKTENQFLNKHFKKYICICKVV